MRILRTTLWKSPMEPTIAIVRECDLEYPIEDSMDLPINDMLIVHDVFEMDGEPTIEEATEAARLRIRERALAEHQMALMYYYDVGMLPKMNRGGVMAMDKPTPLSVDDLKVVLAAEAKHPAYRDQARLALSRDMKVVRLANGEVTEEEL